MELRMHELTILRPPPQPPDRNPTAAASADPESAASPSAALVDSDSPGSSPQRTLPGGGAHGSEVFGLHPVRTGRQSSAVDMPLALWMQWQSR